MSAFSEKIWHKTLKRPYSLYVEDHGGDGPVIIFLHGLAASSATFSELIPQLVENYRCISIDLIGFGQSPKPTWYKYRMNDHMRTVAKAIHKQHLKEPFILVGHSLGSLLATRYAALWPEQVERVVLLSPPVYSPVDSIRSRTARARNQFLLKLYQFLRTNPHFTPQNFKRLSRIVPLPKSISKNPDTWIPFHRTLEQCIEHQTIVEDIIDIKAPIDIFYGTLDQVIVPYNIRKLSKLEKVSIRGMRGIGHDIGRRYANTIAEFLNKLSRKS